MQDTLLIATATNLLEMAVVCTVRLSPVARFGCGADGLPPFVVLLRFYFRLINPKENSLWCFVAACSGAIAPIPTTCREIGCALAFSEGASYIIYGPRGEAEGRVIELIHGLGACLSPRSVFTHYR